MADGAQTNPSLDAAEHDDTNSAKRVTPLLWNGSGTSKAPTPWLTKPYDRLVVTYTDSTLARISTIVSKLGGVTQETITNSSSATVDDFQRT